MNDFQCSRFTKKCHDTYITDYVPTQVEKDQVDFSRLPNISSNKKRFPFCTSWKPPTNKIISLWGPKRAAVKTFNEKLFSRRKSVRLVSRKTAGSPTSRWWVLWSWWSSDSICGRWCSLGDIWIIIGTWSEWWGNGYHGLNSEYKKETFWRKCIDFTTLCADVYWGDPDMQRTTWKVL